MDELISLAPHARCAISGDWAIFLDVRRNRYWAAPVLALRDITGEVPIAGRQLSSFRPRASLRERLTAMAMIAEAETGGGHGSIGRRRGLRWRDVRLPAWGDCVVAWLWADAAVKRGDLERSIAAIAAAKEACTGRSRSHAVSAESLYTAYQAWRIWFPRRFVCLFDTLAFVMFAARRGVAVDVVFGVRGRPFAAHCWAASEGRVLNDEDEYCAAFTPILQA